MEPAALRNGVRIPRFGLGLSHRGGPFSAALVQHAIEKAGVRLYDTAARYGTEGPLGRCIAACSVPREQLFLTSKLWAADVNDVSGALGRTLANLDTEVLDLYLVHWPGSWGVPCSSNGELRVRTWRQMELLLDSGRVRSIGVSNYQEHHLQSLVDGTESGELAGVLPMVNQIELHPFQHPRALMDRCAELGIVVEGWAPLAKGQALCHPVPMAIAKRLGEQPATVLIAWSLAKGAVVIPKTTKVEHLESNMRALQLSLSAEDECALDALAVASARVTWDPSEVD